jgi:hypothetical protein
MVGRRQADGIPQARVVQGGNGPAWAAQKRAWLGQESAPGQPGAVTYARASNYNTVAVLFGLWPLLAVTAMGIALLWTGTVYGTP